MSSLLRMFIREVASGTDTIEDVTFDGPRLEAGSEYISITAQHPRLGAVGHVATLPIDSRDPKEFEFDDNPPWDLLRSDAYADFSALKKKLGHDVGVYVVTSSHVDKRFRGEGLGQAMYLRIMKYLADEKRAVLVPNSAVEGEGATSGSAQRAWGAIPKVPGAVFSGVAFWGGGITPPPIRSRRGHGFQKSTRPRARKFDTDE